MEMDQIAKAPSSRSQPQMMSQTKTMILQSTGNEFQYISPPPSSQSQQVQQQQIVSQHHLTGKEDIVLLAAVADAAEPVDSSTIIEAAGTAEQLQYKTETSNGITTVYSVNLDTLPPPPPPIAIKSATHLSQVGSYVLSSNHPNVSSTNPSTTDVYGRLCYKDIVLYITDPSVEIGRNSTTSTVHFHVGKNVFVSRKHLQLIHDRNKNEFYLMCLSKNGVFVNDVFQRKSSEPLKLPKT